MNPVGWSNLGLVFLAASMGFAVLTLLALLSARRLGAIATTRMTGQMESVFFFADAGRIQRRMLGVAALLFLTCLLSTASWRLAFVLTVCFVCLPWVSLWVWRRRRLEAFRRQTPDTLSLLAEGLRSGGAFNPMLHQVARRMPAPTGQELGMVVRQIRLGTPLDQALGDLDRRLKTEETRLLVAILQMGAASGGQLADALDSLSSATRRKLALEGKVRALTAQGRLQAWVMGVLPFALALVLHQIDPASMRLLIDSRIGQMVLLLVLLLQGCGALMIRRIASIDL